MDEEEQNFQEFQEFKEVQEEQQNYIVERKLKKEKLRREAKRGEILLRRIFKFFRFIFVIFVLYCVNRICNVHYWYVPSDTFTSKNGAHVEILGNKIVTDEKILNELKDYEIPNKPIYKINPNEIKKAIQELTPIKSVYVRRFWLPARFVIMVEEVTPILLISPNEDTPEVAAFAQTGEIITREYLPLNFQHKAVKVLSYGANKDDYDNWDKEKILSLYNIATALRQYSGENVEYLDLRNPHNVFAKLNSVKIRIGELDSTVYERIKTIHNILPTIKTIPGNIKYVDLSWRDSQYLKMENK